ncbi:lipopolysaccharide biosynthesis protein [Mesorhizobium sp. A623]
MSSYWRTVAFVFSGTAFAQLFPLLGSLLVARLYVPAEFGTFMAWLGIAAVTGVFVTGRFEMALALVDDGPRRAEAATATVVTTMLLLSLVAATGAIAYPFVVGLLPPIPPGLVWLFVPAAGALAATQILQAWAAADGRFRALTVMRITQAASITGLQILAGLLWPSATTLAIAHVAGVVVSVAVISWQFPLGCLQEGRHSVIRFWRRYHRFPLFALPADTINTAVVQLPLAILAIRFGVETAGYVALAFRTLGAPISLLGTAVLDVFKRSASESWRTIGSCRGPFIETFLVLSAGSVIATVVFWFAGPQLFVLAFGAQWREAGVAAVILLPLFALRFVASPLSFTFYISEKQHIDLIWQLGLLVMTLVSLSAFGHYESTLRAYALGYGLFYVVYLVLTFRLSAGKQT